MAVRRPEDLDLLGGDFRAAHSFRKDFPGALGRSSGLAGRRAFAARPLGRRPAALYPVDDHQVACLLRIPVGRLDKTRKFDGRVGHADRDQHVLVDHPDFRGCCLICGRRFDLRGKASQQGYRHKQTKRMAPKDTRVGSPAKQHAITLQVKPGRLPNRTAHQPLNTSDDEECRRALRALSARPLDIGRSVVSNTAAMGRKHHPKCPTSPAKPAESNHVSTAAAPKQYKCVLLCAAPPCSCSQLSSQGGNHP